MQGSSHVEQMYSDLGSDWRKALRKKGEWMTTCWELVWDVMGAGGWGGQRGGGWGGYGSETQRAAELTDFTDATGLRERSCAPTDGSWLIWRRGKIHRAGISHVGKQQPCQACWGLHTPGSGQSRMTGENKAAGMKIGVLSTGL